MTASPSIVKARESFSHDATALRNANPSSTRSFPKETTLGLSTSAKRDEAADATKQVRLRLERAVRSGHGLGAHNALLYADARCNQIEALTLHEVLDELMYEAAYEVTNMTRCP